MSTNIWTPLPQWNVVAMNAWLNDGHFTTTATAVNLGSSQQFYILQMQNITFWLRPHATKGRRRLLVEDGTLPPPSKTKIARLHG